MQVAVSLAGRARFAAHVRRLANRALRFGDLAAARELADLGPRGVQPLVDAFPTHRHAAAMMLHEVLGAMGRANTLHRLSEVRIAGPKFAVLLDDGRAVVRSTAVRILGCTNDRRWTHHLERVLREDRDPFVRRATVTALARLGSTDVLAMLLGLVDDRTDGARYEAVRAIGHLGSAACWCLVPLALDHGDEAVRRVAAETVARLADDGAWAALVERLARARCHEVRRTIVEGLGRSRTLRAAPVLVRLLMDDPSPAVREAAADALPLLRDPRVIGALVDSALYDSYSQLEVESPERCAVERYPVREAAAEALIILGGADALALLEEQPSLWAMTG